MAFQSTIETMVVFFLILAVGFAAGKLKVIKQEFMDAFAQIITKIFLLP